MFFVHVSPRDQAAYLKEIARVLAPGGIALCAMPMGATVASCHPAKVGAHRCRAAYSQCWRPRAG
jgi:ubiquinone/menaquinone biosynthesis C-methylase UbiE